MMRVRVCPADEVAPGQMKGFAVDSIEWPVLVANVDGVLHATSSVCPHEDVSLLEGALAAGCITCPGHAYEFDLASGRCAHDSALTLFRFKTTIVDGDLYVELA